MSLCLTCTRSTDSHSQLFHLPVMTSDSLIFLSVDFSAALHLNSPCLHKSSQTVSNKQDRAKQTHWFYLLVCFFVCAFPSKIVSVPLWESYPVLPILNSYLKTNGYYCTSHLLLSLKNSRKMPLFHKHLLGWQLWKQNRLEHSLPGPSCSIQLPCTNYYLFWHASCSFY